jgi:hypothetical protein
LRRYSGHRLHPSLSPSVSYIGIPKQIALGAAMVRSLDQVVDAETGRVLGREGLDQEVYVRLLAGTLDLDSHTPLTGRLRCEVTNTKGEKIELDLCFREIGNASCTRGRTTQPRLSPQAVLC